MHTSAPRYCTRWASTATASLPSPLHARTVTQSGRVPARRCVTWSCARLTRTWRRWARPSRSCAREHEAQTKSPQTVRAVTKPDLRAQLWTKMYESVQAHDAEAVAIVIRAVARLAHQDRLNARAFEELGVGAKAGGRPRVAGVEEVVRDVNNALGVFRAGFLDTLSAFANYNAADALRALLHRPDIVKDIMALMLCPVAEVQSAAQALVGQAYDVDVRLDCLAGYSRTCQTRR